MGDLLGALSLFDDDEDQDYADDDDPAAGQDDVYEPATLEELPPEGQDASESGGATNWADEVDATYPLPPDNVST